MNERQPYEHRIAEKLQQLPSPDVETSWQKMKRLLDDNQQPKSGGGSYGPGAWWRTALIAIVIITGLWLYTENKKSSGKEMAVTNKANTGAAIPASAAADKNDASGKINNTDKKLKATNDNTATLNTIPVNTNKKNTADKDNNATADIHIAPDTKQNALAGKGISIEPAINTNSAADKSKNLKPDDNTNAKTTLTPADKRKREIQAKNVDASSLALHHNNTLLPGIKLNEKNNVLSPKNNTRRKNIKRNNITGNNASNYKPIANPIKNKLTKDPAINADNYGSAVAGSGYNNIPPIKHNNKKEKNNAILTTNSDINDEALLAKQNAWYETLHELSISNEQKPINTFLSVGDSIEAEVDGNALLSKETKDLANKARRAFAEEAMAKKEKKSFRLNLSNVFKPFSLHIDAEPWWAAGFALNNSVAVNAQNRYNYNINAKSGVLGDYIPSPYVQFHLNDFVYMQTELNLSTPQLTPQLLLYQKSADVIGAAGFTQQKSIYVQKLYYFNWPVSLHYSPINNLYFAAGLQFSSFQSGLALIQNKRYSTQGGNPNDPVSIENSIEKFKDDSLAAKLSPTEWRWQTGADYYWNRFTIGLRYNKAFKDLLNVNVSSSLPLTTNRNSAFLFFMRYNLFEGRNKNNSGSKQSLVRY